MTYEMVVMSVLFFLIFFVTTVSCLCPYDSLHYKEGNVSVCYIVLHFQEIKYIRVELWLEGDDQKRWHWPNYDGRDNVHSYPEALRMCQLIKFIKYNDHIPTTHFDQRWRTIPGPDIQLRLPMPRTTSHLNWLIDNCMVDVYNDITGGGRNRGRMWLGINKSSNVAMNPISPKDSLKKKPGDCGFLYRQPTPSAGIGYETGLYYVDCKDEWIEGRSDTPHDDYYQGAYALACEFDEPQDCVQKKVHNVCEISGFGGCVEMESYVLETPPHPRFGLPCQANMTTQKQCPPEHQYQCASDCVWSEWEDVSPCYVVWDDGKRYVCDEDDDFGYMDRWRSVKRRAIYGGQCKGKTLRQMYCTCGGYTIRVGMAILVGIVATGWMVSEV